MTIILLSLSLYFSSLPSSGGLTMILRSYCIEMCNNNFGINFFRSFHKLGHNDTHLKLEVAQSEDDLESKGKGPL